MDHSKKLAFITQMTAQALDHVARTPNIAAPDGKMSHDKKLAFVNQMAKAGLQHFDVGGAVAGGTSLDGPSGTRSAPGTVNNSGLIGSIGDTLGLNNNFQATAAPIQAGTNAAQLNQAYNGVQSGLSQQQGIADTLTPGVSQGANAQSSLSNQLMAQANGQGPNPAQAQFKQNSQALAGQQAGAIASQKGISPALAARMIAQQGTSAQQSAAGQGATLAAQQQIAAQQNLQNLSANQVAQGASAVQGVNNAQQNEQNILQNANSSHNNAQVGMQSNLNNVNSNVAAENQQQAGNITSGVGGMLSNIPVVGSLFAKGGQVKGTRMMASGGLTAAPTSGPQSYVGQWLSSSGPAGGGPSIAATGGPASISIPAMQTNDKAAPEDDTPENSGQGPTAAAAKSLNSDIPYASAPDYGAMLADGGWISSTSDSSSPSVGSTPGPAQLAPLKVGGGGGDSGGGGGAGGISSILPLLALAANGGLMKNGGNVKAGSKKEKASVTGDSYSNDKIPAMLSEGELVIDRATMQDKGPMGQMARALAMHIQKRNKK